MQGRHQMCERRAEGVRSLRAEVIATLREMKAESVLADAPSVPVILKHFSGDGSVGELDGSACRGHICTAVLDEGSRDCLEPPRFSFG